MNEVSIYVDDKQLIVAFGDDRTAVMELETDEERELVKGLLDDPNLWASFLSSLSAGVTQTLGK